MELILWVDKVFQSIETIIRNKLKIDFTLGETDEFDPYACNQVGYSLICDPIDLDMLVFTDICLAYFCSYTVVTIQTSKVAKWIENE